MVQRRQFTRNVARRTTDWGFGPDLIDQALSASGKILGTTALTIGIQATVVRLRGVFDVFLTSAASIGDGFIGAVGVCLVNSDAFAAGVGSVPGPLTDSNWDAWFYHRFFSLHALTATLADGVNGVAAHERFQIDSKAMRKWDPAETLTMVVDVVERGAAAMRINSDTRLLLKET